MLKYIWRDKKQLIIIIGVILVCSIAIAIGIYAQITNTKIKKTAEEKKEAALDKVKEILQTIGYSMQDTTRTSYLSMLLAK